MPSGKIKLLIVDDEPQLRTGLSLILSEFQYDVRSAEDGLSALCAIEQATPDIILSDLSMPGMSGFALLAEVRSRFPTIRVIAMSGSFCGSEIPHGVAADAFYAKGTSVNSLLKMVDTMACSGWLPTRPASDPASPYSLGQVVSAA